MCSQERLDLQTLDLVLESADLAHQVGRLVGGDRAGDDGAGDTAGATESHLGGDVDVWHVLVLAKKRQVEKNGEWGGIGSQDLEKSDFLPNSSEIRVFLQSAR